MRKIEKESQRYVFGVRKSKLNGAVDEYFGPAIESVLGKNTKVKHIEATLKLIDTFMTQDWQSSLEYVSV